MNYRETTVTVYGTTRTIRTERPSGTTRQLETAHTRAVRTALQELHTAGKDQALTAAKAAAVKTDAAARHHHSGPAATAAHHAHQAVKRIERRKFEAPSFQDFKAGTRPHPPVKFNLTPTDPMFAGLHEYIDPDAPATDPTPAEEPRPLTDAKTFLDSPLASLTN